MPSLWDGAIRFRTCLLSEVVCVLNNFWSDSLCRLALQAVNYVGENSYIWNVSRVSPTRVVLRVVPGGNTRYNLYIDTVPHQPLVAYSAGFLEHSQLGGPSDTGLRQRYLRLIFHEQEWERFVGFVATATGYRVLHAQLARDALQFSSRAQASDATPSSERFLVLFEL